MTSDYMIQQDLQQSDRETARRCPMGDGDHGRLTVMGGGAGLACFNRIKESEAKRIAEGSGPIARLEGSKAFICAYQEAISQ